MYIFDRTKLAAARARAEDPSRWNVPETGMCPSRLHKKDQLHWSFEVTVLEGRATERCLRVRSRPGYITPPGLVAELGRIFGLREPYTFFACVGDQIVEARSRLHCVEASLVLAGDDLLWQDDPEAETSYLPDTPKLHEVLWDRRFDVTAHAHTHPWFGRAAPSAIDLKTYRLIEKHILARPIDWYVVTFDDVALVSRIDLTEEFEITRVEPPDWTGPLRRWSLL